MAAKGFIKVKDGETVTKGDIVRLVSQEVEPCSSSKDRLVAGIILENPIQPDSNVVPLMDIFGNEYFQSNNPPADPKCVLVLVEGLTFQGKICDEGGAVSAGDLLVTSSTPGFLKKQLDGAETSYDDVCRDYTVAKAVDDVTFDGNGEAINVRIYMLK
jgi:hypothetical protein